MRYRSSVFVEDLLHVLHGWLSIGEHVIVAMDTNQNVSLGKLAQDLRQEPYNMTCLLQWATGEQVPISHFSGKGKISMICGSSGVRQAMVCDILTGMALVTIESWSLNSLPFMNLMVSTQQSPHPLHGC